FTNKNGEFQFNELNVEETYYLGFPTLDETIMADVSLSLINEKGNALQFFKRLKESRFEYVALPAEEYNMLPLISINGDGDLTAVTGQLYKVSAGDLKTQETLYLINDSKAIIDSTKTDISGKFSFGELNPNQNYKIQLANKVSPMNI